MRGLKRAFMAMFAACALWAQHSYTAADLEDGARLYQQNCSSCHGPEGDRVPGVNFAKGKFSKVGSDDDLTRIIVKGIPGTRMPPASFPDFMAFPVMAYVRSMSAPGRSTLAHGEAERGKLVFEGKGECLSCHRVGSRGSRLGPDLTDIGGLRREVQLEKALMDPAKSPAPEYRLVRVVTKDGTEYEGRLLNLDTFTIQMMDSGEQLRSFFKSDLREYRLITDSGMPSYKDKLSKDELADVVSYLGSLKGEAAKSPPIEPNTTPSKGSTAK